MANDVTIADQSRAEKGNINKQDEYNQLVKELADKELELATLKNSLGAFERSYTTTVGVLLAELDALEMDIALELLRLHPEEKYKKDYQSAERKAKESQDAVGKLQQETRKKDFHPSDDLKKIFYRVAKTVHPDLTVNEEEREYRTALMARAIEAYKNGDQNELEKILHEWENRDKTHGSHEAHEDSQDQLSSAIIRIKKRIEEIELEISVLKESILYHLMIRVSRATQENRDLLAEMATDLARKIQVARIRLERLKQQNR